MPRGKTRKHPIFRIVRVEQGRSMAWLARETGFSHGYVRDVACGLQKGSPRFRSACAELLGLDEATLFHPADTSSAAPASEDGASGRALEPRGSASLDEPHAPVKQGLAVVPEPRLSAHREVQFWAKVDASGDCWEWCAAVSPQGYGQFKQPAGTSKWAHRIAYELLVGPLADGVQIDHLCRNRRCINPDHLEPVDPLENWRRGAAHTRRNVDKTHCPKGHPYDAVNTSYQRRVDGRILRVCRACAAAHYKRWAAKKAAEKKPSRSA